MKNIIKTLALVITLCSAVHANDVSERKMASERGSLVREPRGTVIAISTAHLKVAKVVALAIGITTRACVYIDKSSAIS